MVSPNGLCIYFVVCFLFFVSLFTSEPLLFFLLSTRQSGVSKEKSCHWPRRRIRRNLKPERIMKRTESVSWFVLSIIHSVLFSLSLFYSIMQWFVFSHIFTLIQMSEQVPEWPFSITYVWKEWVEWGKTEEEEERRQNDLMASNEKQTASPLP